MKYFILPLILSLFLGGCQSGSLIRNNKGLLDWNYGDLRLLDAVDAKEPNNDLIAVYTRIDNQLFQIRLDFLDLTKYLGKDIYIPLDTNPGGEALIKCNDNGTIISDIAWDYLIKISDSGNIEVVNGHLIHLSGMELFILYDSLQDIMVISFTSDSLPIQYGLTKLQVIITSPNQSRISDTSGPISIDSPSPPRTKVLFAFWNTFTSLTPAQTLRSWSGAHTGPMSGRHGLYYLLDAAAKARTPIFLLDILSDENLSALDYIHALPVIKNQAEQEILALPEVGNQSVISGTSYISTSTQLNTSHAELDFYKEWQVSNNVKSIYMGNNFNFLVLIDKYIILNKNKIYFIGGNDYAKFLSSYSKCEFVPFYSEHTSLRVIGNLSLDCKYILLTNALTQPSTPMIFGGDFSKSVLGEPTISHEVFKYIVLHPWIQVLSVSDLVSSRSFLSPGFLPHQGIPPTSNSRVQSILSADMTHNSKTQKMVFDALLQAPKNQLTDLAWRVYTSLTHSVSPKLLALQSNYIGQIRFILAGAMWAENPSPMIACVTDFDNDGSDECILANDTIFAIVEPEGGYIPFVFTKDAQGIHQIIGPTWEFEVGLSDPSSWNLNLGERGDSAQLLGAFQDKFNDWNSYNVELINNKLELYDPNSLSRKSITILPNGFHIDIANPDQLYINLSIPLVVDPWIRFTSGWGDRYISKSKSFSFQWGIKSGEMVEIRSTNPLNAFSFNDTRLAMFHPEDPNYDYLQGHYLPFPMSLAIVQGSGNFSADILINP